MGYRITLIDVTGTPVEFDADPNRSVVRAAAQAGFELAIGCLQGRCAVCRAHLRAGEVRALRRPSPNARGGPERRDDGYVLLCSIAPLSNLVLEPLSPWNSRK